MSKERLDNRFFKKWLMNQQCELDKIKEDVSELKKRVALLTAEVDGLILGLKMRMEKERCEKLKTDSQPS